jgi:phage protein D
MRMASWRHSTCSRVYASPGYTWAQPKRISAAHMEFHHAPWPTWTRSCPPCPRRDLSLHHRIRTTAQKAAARAPVGRHSEREGMTSRMLTRGKRNAVAESSCSIQESIARLRDVATTIHCTTERCRHHDCTTERCRHHDYTTEIRRRYDDTTGIRRHERIDRPAGWSHSSFNQPIAI